MHGKRHLMPLTRDGLMKMENRLCAYLEKFIAFSDHVLYFPIVPAGAEPDLLPGEKKLLLPLWQGEESVGVLVLHGVNVRECRKLLVILPQITALCLENIVYAGNLGLDALTGLANEDELYARMEDEADFLRGAGEEPAPLRGQVALYRMCLGLVVFRFCDAVEVSRKLGHAAVNDALARMSACLADLPAGALAARTGRHELAILFHAPGRKSCQELADAAMRKMAGISMRDPLTGRDFSPRLSCGHALYPQDMDGSEMTLPMYEQSRRFMDKARLAASTDGSLGNAGRPGATPALAFANILREGGLVSGDIPPRGLRVSLGKNAKAAEGMRFDIRRQHAGGHMRIGEIVLVRVGEDDSLAEILDLEDASEYPRPGDRLLLLAAGSGGSYPRPRTGGAPCPPASSAPVAQCLGHGEFLSLLAQRGRQCARFTLALMRLDVPDNVDPGYAQERLHMAAAVWREAFGGEQKSFCGFYGSNGLVFFHAGACGQDLAEAYGQISRRCAERDAGTAFGLATYPFMHFDRGDMERLAIRALEYALLLPEPRVGLCNSLALNISADKLYSLGDMFGAIQEYKLAIMADNSNIMALNSLGVCQAALGSHGEAMRCFKKALSLRPEPAQAAQICYNLGTVCQTLGKRRSASIYYRRCLEHSPRNLYAHLRLGQLCEQSGRKSEARAHYENAARLEEQDQPNRNLARLQLARLAKKQRKNGEARELLHDALVCNPGDASALLLLAQTYLDNNEDPAMAELLARKSISLRESQGALRTLARALHALGREDESRLAEARAANL